MQGSLPRSENPPEQHKRRVRPDDVLDYGLLDDFRAGLGMNFLLDHFPVDFSARQNLREGLQLDGNLLDQLANTHWTGNAYVANGVLEGVVHLDVGLPEAERPLDIRLRCVAGVAHPGNPILGEPEGGTI